jgi:hypothetical protein
MQFDTYDTPFLVGLKLVNDKGQVVLCVGQIDKPSRMNNDNYPVKEFAIDSDERLVGVRSWQSGEGYAQHFNCQLLIARDYLF